MLKILVLIIKAASIGEVTDVSQACNIDLYTPSEYMIM